MDNEEKIQMILGWVDDEDRGGFDVSFVLSLEKFLNQHGFLTTAQEAALDNIIKRFHIKP